MTVMDLALHLDETVAGVTMLSGAPIVVEQWAVRLKKHKGIRVLVRKEGSSRLDSIIRASECW